ncbi:MAG: hypothetical protein NTW10_00135 [Bacteroidetes bacterium]|nr:hypothetical protein [Bacteroidota bacterium]
MSGISKTPVLSFDQYLKRRGYIFFSFRQALFKVIRKSFSQGSFCGFWRMWNPFSGYLIFLLYSFLGGNRKRPYVIPLVFLTSGIVFHDLVIFLITGTLSIVFTITFFLYSVIFSIEHRIFMIRKAFKTRALTRSNLPVAYRVILNMTLLAIPLTIGFLINFLAFPDSAMNRIFQFMFS